MSRPLRTAFREQNDVEILTSRVTRFEDRSLSATIGRSPEPPREIVDDAVIDLTAGQDEQALEDIFDDEVIDLTVDNIAGPGRLRNNELALTHFRVPGGFVIRPGDVVEVTDIHLASYQVEFVQVEIIAQVIEAGQPRTRIRGIPYSRTRRLKAKLPSKTNEVVKILHYNRNNDEASRSPILVDVCPDSVLQKRNLVTTNALWPTHRLNTLPYGHIKPKSIRVKEIEAFGRLVCRWELHVYFVVQGRRTKPEEEALVRIHAEDADNEYRVSEDGLCNQWRGVRVKGGSSKPGANDASIDIENSLNHSAARGEDQKYTVFDSYSGAGGVSRGAQGAGFKIEFAVDKSPDVWATYKTNFPGTRLYKMSIDEFILNSKNENIRVDVLHLSPPCQFFSPAHTRLAVHDDENIFALFGCNELIKKTRPRLITLEQTFGITHERHLPYFRALIGDFTQLGYSLRWKIVRLCRWGSAQDRKRLILIAAGPGERLPLFPKATHSVDGEDGLKPYTTIHQSIRGIRPGDDGHDLGCVKFHRPARPSYDAHRLATTITTRGGEMTYHPNGTRDFTMREYASLQGFPRNHRFRGLRTSVKRQIGNAFPPNTVRVLYSHLEDWLLKEDGMNRYERPMADVVMLDEDSDTSVVGSASGSAHDASPEMMEIDDDDQANKDVIDLT